MVVWEFRLMLWGLRLILAVLGVFLFLSGLLFCIAPKAVLRVNEWGKRLLFTDAGTLRHNIKTGVLFMIIGAAIFFVNNYYAAKLQVP